MIIHGKIISKGKPEIIYLNLRELQTIHSNSTMRSFAPYLEPMLLHEAAY